MISAVHLLRRTPEPTLTIGVVATIVFPSFAVWARKTRDDIEVRQMPPAAEVRR